ncbi:MAG: secretin N-terminal domain-containing protein [Bacillota bacterium]
MKRKIVVILSIIVCLIVLMQPVNAAKVEGEEQEEPRITMTFFSTDLREALKEISLQTGINIIPDQTVGGQITAEFKDAKIENVLDRILAGGGYTYRKVEDYYLIGLPSPKNSTFSRLSEIKIIDLNYVSSKQVFTLLPDFFQPYVYGSGTDNRLTISAPQKKLDRIESFIQELDQPTAQVKVKVLITEVDSSKMKEIGNKLFSYDKEGSPNKTASYELDKGLLTFEGDMHGKFLGQLRLLEKEHQAEVKADPYVLVTSGKEAKLFVGKEENIIIDDSDDDYDDSRIEEIEVGMKLNLKAEVKSNQLIDLQINPEISHFLDEKRPDIVVRKNALTTSLRLKSGQTAILGGMTKQNQAQYEEGMPGFNKVPLVRWLFGHKSKREAKRELLILVTPTIQEQ